MSRIKNISDAACGRQVKQLLLFLGTKFFHRKDAEAQRRRKG
jgi:hypothetical protein